MRSLRIPVLALILGTAVPAAHADPLVTKGIGLSNCGKLANDMKPSEGLNHMPNALLFYWMFKVRFTRWSGSSSDEPPYGSRSTARV